MTAGQLDLTVRKGSTFSKSFTWTDSEDAAINITGWTPQCDVRKNPRSSVIFSFVAAVTNGAAGQFSLTLTDEVSDSLQTGVYHYDLVFDKGDGTRSDPVLEGSVVVKDVYSQKT